MKHQETGIKCGVAYNVLNHTENRVIGTTGILGVFACPVLVFLIVSESRVESREL